MYSHKLVPTVIGMFALAACGTTSQNGATTAQNARYAEMYPACDAERAQCRRERADLQARVDQLAAKQQQYRKTLEFADRRAKTYRAIAKELRSVFAPDEVPVKLRNGLMIVQLPNDILFDLGATRLKETGKEVLRKAATVLKNAPASGDRRFLIAGHTDTIPVAEGAPYESNWELSTLRSLAVLEFLIEQGVKPELLAAAGYGETLPEASNETEAGRTQNRRTEIVVYPTIDEVPAIPDLNGRISALLEEEEPSPAAAQPTPDAIPAEPQQAAREPQEAPAEPQEAPADDIFADLTPRGLSINAGAGILGFTEGEVRDFTDDGGLWTIRATYGTRSRLAIEGSYTGGAQDVDALGLDNDAVLLSTGLEATGRLNLLTGESAWQPYVGIGLAWRNYNIVNADINASALEDNDNVFEVPLTAGVSYRVGGNFVLDARGVFRPTFDSDLVDDAVVDGGSLHSYGIMLGVGYEQ